MIMFKCLRGSAQAYLANSLVTSLLLSSSALRYAAHGDIVESNHHTDWGMRSFAVAGTSSWNVLPVNLRSSFFSLDVLEIHLKAHLFGWCTHDRARTFEFFIIFCKMQPTVRF
jgi:hypothetical protein